MAMGQINKGGTLTATQPRENYHIEIDEAIYSLGNVKQELRLLRDRITGTNEETPNVSGEGRSQPPLSEVLIGGAGAIQENRDQCLKLVSEIEILLF